MAIARHGNVRMQTDEKNGENNLFPFLIALSQNAKLDGILLL